MKIPPNTTPVANAPRMEVVVLGASERLIAGLETADLKLSEL